MRDRGRVAVGVGWRAPHDAALRADAARLDFAEVHAENHFGEGAGLADVLRLREALPVSLHGVGLGLGSARGIDPDHLDRLARLVTRVDPFRVSEHAAFARVAPDSAAAVRHGADLWPLPCSTAALDRLVSQVQQVQERLKRPILVEHLSSYLRWQDMEMDEPAFFMALCRRSGCGLLLDLNNLVVNALNDGAPSPDEVSRRVAAWVDALDPEVVGEVHLAGHTDHGGLVIDDHGAPIPPLVWQAYAHALHRLGPVPTLVEWDSQLPEWPVLLAEAQAVRERAEQALVVWTSGAASWGERPVPTPSPGVALPPVDPAGDRANEIANGLANDLADEQWHWWQAVQAAIQCPPRGDTEPAVAGVTRGLKADAPERLRQVWPAAGAHSLRQRALWVYAVQALGHAERALAAAYPRLHGRVGDEALKALGRDLWQAHPCTSGDLAEWGGALAAWLEGAQADAPASAGLRALLDVHPDLPALARLEWALHQAARADEPVPDSVDFAALAGLSPSLLRLVPAAGGTLLADAPQALPDLGTTWAWVWRSGGAVAVAGVSRVEAAFLGALLSGLGLEACLAHWVGTGLVTEAELAPTFQAWWLRALQAGWLAGWSRMDVNGCGAEAVAEPPMEAT